MLLAKHLIIAILIHTVKSTAIPNTDLICPDQIIENCYPKLFTPTKNWQVILEGQEIPPGLHIRLNIDTLLKEAKLLDPEEMGSENNQVQVVSVDDTNQNHEIDNEDDEFTRQLREKVAAHKQKQKIESGTSMNTISSIIDSGKIVEDVNLLDELDTLLELSHDLDFGIRITNPSFFSKLFKVIDDKNSGNFEINDKIMRIIAQSIRNNPIAIDNILTTKPKIFQDLLYKLQTEHNGVLQKRILGIIGGLIDTPQGKKLFLRDGGIRELVTIFGKLNKDSQIRCLGIIEDMDHNLNKDENLLKRENSDDEEEPVVGFSKYLQGKLINISSESDIPLYFDKLVELHKENKSLKPTSKFLNWLTVENQNRKLAKREDEVSNKMVIARHEVFGNPMGLRKALADEL